MNKRCLPTVPPAGSPHRPSCCAPFWWSENRKYPSFSCVLKTKKIYGETINETWHIITLFYLKLFSHFRYRKDMKQIQHESKLWKKQDDQRIPELGQSGLEANELQGLNDISQEYIIAFVRGPRDVVRLKPAEVAHTTLGTLGTNTLSAARIPLTLTGEACAPKGTGTYEVFEHKLDALYLSTCKLIVYTSKTEGAFLVAFRCWPSFLGS